MKTKSNMTDNREINQVICGDCLEVMKTLDIPSNAVIITDPPYDDYHQELYKYKDGLLDFLDKLPNRQFIFWSAKTPFPLSSYSAIHIWDKKCGVGSMYERIFERNGGKAYRVFRHYLINSTVAAKYAKDVFTGHKSQKPIQLMEELVEKFTKPGQLIIDPFAGSGSTLVAAQKLGRQYIGIEINQEYIEIINNRINNLPTNLL